MRALVKARKETPTLLSYNSETSPRREILAKKGAGVLRMSRDIFGNAFTKAAAISWAFISPLPKMNTRTLFLWYASSATGR